MQKIKIVIDCIVIQRNHLIRWADFMCKPYCVNVTPCASDSFATYGAIQMCFDWLIDWLTDKQTDRRTTYADIPRVSWHCMHGVSKTEKGLAYRTPVATRIKRRQMLWVSDLLWEQFFAQRVQSDELSGQQASLKEALSNEHNFTDKFKVRHNHCTRPARPAKHITHE